MILLSFTVGTMLLGYKLFNASKFFIQNNLLNIDKIKLFKLKIFLK